MHSYQDPNDIFHRTRTNVSKMYMEPQKAPHNNSNPEKEEQSWRNHTTYYQTISGHRNQKSMVLA